MSPASFSTADCLGMRLYCALLLTDRSVRCTNAVQTSLQGRTWNNVPILDIRNDGRCNLQSLAPLARIGPKDLRQLRSRSPYPRLICQAFKMSLACSV